MSFQNSHLPILKFAERYGNLGITPSIFDYVRAVSDANTSLDINSATFIKEPGKKRKVTYTYFPVLCDSNGSCSTDVCTMEGTKVEPTQRSFYIEQCTASDIFTLEKDDLRLVDGQWTYSSTMGQIIASQMPILRRKLGLEMVTRLYALAGVHPDGSDTKRVATTDSNTGVINPLGKFKIDKEFSDAGLGFPYIYGGNEVYNWKAMASIGTPNMYGQNIGRISTNASWYDDGLSEIVMNDSANGGWILGIDPQVFKFVTYSENAGIFSTSLDSLSDINKLYFNGGVDQIIEGTYYDPGAGILWDMDVRYECKQWHVQFKLRWDFLIMPEMVCGVQGMNGIMKYRTCPEVEITCPAGSPVASPVAPTTFSWTPNVALFPQVMSVSFNGYNVSWNEPQAVSNVTELVALLNSEFGAGFFSTSGSPVSAVTYSGYKAESITINGTVNGTFA